MEYVQVFVYLRLLNGNWRGCRILLHPLVDRNKYSNCEKCLQICPFADKNYKETKLKEELFDNVMKVYPRWVKNEDIRYKSAFGGIVIAISLEIMEKDCLIIGTA